MKCHPCFQHDRRSFLSGLGASALTYLLANSARAAEDAPPGQDRQEQRGLGLPGWPRGMREALAAAYVGLSFSTFRREWREGRAPGPVRLTAGRQVWLRDDLDRWLDRKAGRPKHTDVFSPRRGLDALVGEWDAACGDPGGPAVS